MENNQRKRIYFATLSLYITLLPLLFDLIYFIVAAQSPSNWGYIVLAFFLLPSVHAFLSISGLVLGVISRFRKENRKSAIVSIILASIQILFSIPVLFAVLTPHLIS